MTDQDPCYWYQIEIADLTRERDELDATCALLYAALQDAMKSTGGALVVQDYDQLNRALVASSRRNKR
jgi:uncharacterized protein YwlG (UPF0340 family)